MKRRRRDAVPLPPVTPLGRRMLEKGYSPTELSKATGVARTTIYDLMTQPNWVPRKPEVVLALCRALNMRPFELLGLPDGEGPVYNYFTAKRFHEALTVDGRLQPEHYHALASVIKRIAGEKGKIIEAALRGVALVLAEVTAAAPPRRSVRPARAEGVEQLRLPIKIALTPPVAAEGSEQLRII